MQFKPCPEQPLSEEPKGNVKTDKNSTPTAATVADSITSSSGSVQVVVGMCVILPMLLMMS